MDTATAYIYFFPNEEVEGSLTQGIVENRMLERNTGRRAVYEAPADWTIYLALNVGNLNGYINVRSSVVDFEDEDEPKLDNEWLPTSNYFITKEEKDTLRREEDAEAQRLYEEEMARLQELEAAEAER